MFGALLSGLGGTLINSARRFLPNIINWGVNKLTNSNFGKTYISPDLAHSIGGLGQKLGQTGQKILDQTAFGRKNLDQYGSAQFNRQKNNNAIPQYQAQNQQNWQDDEPLPQQIIKKYKKLKKRAKARKR